MLLKRVLLATVVLTALVLTSFVITPSKRSEAKTGGPDSYGYRYIDSRDPEPKIPFIWIDATNGTDTGMNGDDTYVTINLPFSFPYYGKQYTRIYPSSNGLIGLEYATTQWWNRNIPTTSPRGILAVYWDDLWVYSSYGHKVYYMFGGTAPNRWVVIEWYHVCNLGYSGSSYEYTFEAILYESGLIVFSYYDTDTSASWYNNGASATVGINSPDGRTGVRYLYNSGTLKSGTTIMFSEKIIQIEDYSYELQEQEERVAYAMYKPYRFSVTVSSETYKNVESIHLTLGPGYEEVKVKWTFDGTSWNFQEEYDPFDFISLDPSRCTATHDAKHWTVHFYIYFTFNYPLEDYRGFSLIAWGKGAIPGMAGETAAYRVERNLEFVGNPVVVGEVNGELSNGDWVQGGEVVTFTGVKVVYEGTTLSPPNNAFSVSVVDERGNYYTDRTSSGREANIDVLMPLERVDKTFEFVITDVPPDVQLTHFIPFTLRVDPMPPVSPTWFYIHAESYMDENTEYDNDPYVYLTWSSGVDYESG
ncbi:MAG: hypothetical protein DRN55_08795, partial [Thermoplasmata archaeon]